jgi:signal transduction histidine kinase
VRLPSFMHGVLTRTRVPWTTALGLLLPLLAFMLTVGFATPMLATSAYTSSEIERGKQLATSFAQSSARALRYRSAADARESTARALTFPGTVYAGIYDADGRRLHADGALPDESRPPASAPSLDQAVLAIESDLYWHFLAPVRMSELSAKPSSAAFQLADKYLGYVQLVQSKAQVNRVRATLFASFVSLSLVALLLAAVVVVLLVIRWSRPLRQFTESIERAAVTGGEAATPSYGPPEFLRMAEAIVRILAERAEREKQLRWREHELEAEVRLATEHITRARDIAESANRHKSEFLATVSHELRTPLHIIIGYTESVMGELRTPEQSSLVADLGHVMQAARDLLRQINNLLDFEKAERGAMAVLLQPTNATAVAREMIDAMLPMARRGNNRIELDVNAEFTLVTDEEKLRRILLNLLSNACKFTVGGSVTLSIVSDGADVHIAVRDTGRGIAPADQQTIFEAFQQVGSDADRSRGTGLGLAIVSRFCAMLGGVVSVDSVLGRGSTFIVKLPIVPARVGSDRTAADAMSADEPTPPRAPAS